MPERKKKITDLVFGELILDWLWKGAIEIDPYGEIELMVDCKKNGEAPTKRQQDTFEDLRLRFPDFKNLIDQAILDYYLENREMYLLNAIDPAEEVPKLKNTKQLNRILTSGPLLVIEIPRKGHPEASLSWNTTFDEEHGLKVEITDGEISYVGP